MEEESSPEEPQEAGCPPCALGKASQYGAVVARAKYGLAYLVLFPTWPLT